jgi:hypothetical protein
MEGHHRPAASSKAGLAYAVIVFGAGFILGALRLLVVVPRLGATAAVLLEAPVMLALSWWVCRWCVARFRVAASWQARVLMGMVALLGLQLAELSLAATLFDQPPASYLRGLGQVPGVIGLAAQLAFASWPLMQLRFGNSVR